MSCVPMAFIAGFVLILISYLLFTLPSAQRSREGSYRTMDGRKLVETNVTARMMRKRMQVFALLMPLLLAGVAVVVQDAALTEALLPVIILLACVGVSARKIFWEVERLSTIELEHRKLKTESESRLANPEPNEEDEGTGS